MPLVLGPLLVPLLAFLAAVVLLGLSQAATSQHGSSNSGTFWDIITGRFYFHKVAGFAAQFARWVVSHFAGGQLRMVARWFGALGTLVGGLLLANPAALEAIVHAIERVMHRGDPRARAKAQSATHQAKVAHRAATHANTHARSVGHALDRYKGRTNPQIRHLVHETTVALPRDIANVKHRERWAEKQMWKIRDRVKELEDGALKTFDWLRDHPGTAAVGAFTGAVAIALDTLGLGSVRCPNLRNLFNKRGCGMWDGLDALLGLLVTGLVIENYDTYIREAQGLAEEVTKGLLDLLNAKG